MACPSAHVPWVLLAPGKGTRTPYSIAGGSWGVGEVAEWCIHFDVLRSPCPHPWLACLLDACSLSLNTLFSKCSANEGRESLLVFLSGADLRPRDSQPKI